MQLRRLPSRELLKTIVILSLGEFLYNSREHKIQLDSSAVAQLFVMVKNEEIIILTFS